MGRPINQIDNTTWVFCTLTASFVEVLGFALRNNLPIVNRSAAHASWGGKAVTLPIVSLTWIRPLLPSTCEVVRAAGLGHFRAGGFDFNFGPDQAAENFLFILMLISSSSGLGFARNLRDLIVLVRYYFVTLKNNYRICLCRTSISFTPIRLSLFAPRADFSLICSTWPKLVHFASLTILNALLIFLLPLCFDCTFEWKTVDSWHWC